SPLWVPDRPALPLLSMRALRGCPFSCSTAGIELDSKGFVLTGMEGDATRHTLETSRSGVYAIGDVRSGSVQRVASAVGEGAQVVAALHTSLAPDQGNSTRI